MEERVEAAQADQKNLFLIVFQVLACYFYFANASHTNFVLHDLALHHDSVGARRPLRY